MRGNDILLAQSQFLLRHPGVPKPDQPPSLQLGGDEGQVYHVSLGRLANDLLVLAFSPSLFL